MGEPSDGGHEQARRRGPAGGVYVLLVIALVILLAGCGAGGPHATTASSGITSVHILRTSPFPQNHIPPLDQTVTDSTKAQRLYDAVQALPSFPQGTINCPAGSGEAYNLTFYRDEAEVSWAVVKPEGCRRVTLPNGDIRRSINQDHFWRMFADALGVPEADLFQPPRPDGPSAPTPRPSQP
jgi:hypothetical protein